MEGYAVRIDDVILKKHKINAEEYEKIKNLLKREPNLVELGVFSAMWSEHCSYKTTRVHLAKMHTKGGAVICGPGENAGIVDGLDDDAIVFKMESHNHPSYIEPFNGAATGVGGILRDVFTMGARPIATLNSLRFGEFGLEKTKKLLDGVVNGIGFYGNCVGVPCLGGECTFDESYNQNNLTNAMAVGVVKKDKIFYSAANKVGGKVVYFGSKTGKDGIHGASMSSDSFDSAKKQEKPTVQIGDPFIEKLLIEACLELMGSGCVLSIQDMGAAGLTCSCAEMAGKGNNGIEIDVSLVPLRDSNMNAYEIMLSESQERMLMILNEGMEEKAQEILKKWQLDFAIIGQITDTKRFIIKENGVIVAEMPIHALSEEAPIYKRPFVVENDETVSIEVTKKEEDVIDVLKQIMQSPDMIDKSFIWQRYDTTVTNKSIILPGEANAGVVGYGEEKIANSKTIFAKEVLIEKVRKVGGVVESDGSYKTFKGLGITSKSTPRYNFANPKEGAKHAVAAVYRSLCAVGTKPIAITNCLNFASPENPRIMGQIVASIEGISEAAKALDFPVVSGNVSLYNQTNESAIKPTPAIGGVGISEDYFRACNYKLKQEEDFIFVIGETNGHMVNTLYANEVEGIKGGACPKVNLLLEKQNADFVRLQIQEGIVSACANVLDGGLLGSLCEMSLASDLKIGFSLQLNDSNLMGLSLIEYGFSEDSGRFICSVPKQYSVKFIENAVEAGVIYSHIGFTCADVIQINSKYLLSIEELKKVNKIL